MKKGQIYEGNVLRVDFPNKGIVACEGNENDICVIKDVLPMQKVSFSVAKKRNGRAEGRLLEVLEKSPKLSKKEKVLCFCAMQRPKCA